MFIMHIIYFNLFIFYVIEEKINTKPIILEMHHTLRYSKNVKNIMNDIIKNVVTDIV